MGGRGTGGWTVQGVRLCGNEQQGGGGRGEGGVVLCGPGRGGGLAWGTGRCKGYGFVSMTNAEDADEVRGGD